MRHQRTCGLEESPPHSPQSSPPRPLLPAEPLRAARAAGFAGALTLDGGGGVYGRLSTSALIFSLRNCAAPQPQHGVMPRRQGAALAWRHLGMKVTRDDQLQQ